MVYDGVPTVRRIGKDQIAGTINAHAVTDRTDPAYHRVPIASRPFPIGARFGSKQPSCRIHPLLPLRSQTTVDIELSPSADPRNSCLDNNFSRFRIRQDFLPHLELLRTGKIERFSDKTHACYPLTPPANKPPTSCLRKTRKRRMVGNAMIVPPAITRPQLKE